MSHQHSSRTPRPIRFLFENSLFLVFGAVAALLWANLHEESYHDFVHYQVLPSSETHHASEELGHDQTSELGAEHGAAEHGAAEHGAAEHGADHVAADPVTEDHAPADHAPAAHAAHADGSAANAGTAASHNEGNAHGGGHAQGKFTLHWLINDLMMAFFFAIAGKEVWESVLPGGALSNPRKAATPLLATLGGIVGPAGVYLAGVFLFAGGSELADGWAIPCATDIAFSYLVARMIFGPGHPAIAFLLLLAIADDAAGLVILAVFFPQGDLQLSWLLLTIAAVGLGFFFRKLKLHSFWFYLVIPGAMSWFSFYKAGLHPALGLVPIIPCMPHAHTDLGLFAAKELNRNDTLNEFEHWWKNPVELVLGLFGLVNAGVVLSSVGTGTWLVLAGLLIGKPVGITFFTWLGERVFRLEVPAGMSYRHVITLGNIAAIGFTVALFMSTAAFKNPGAVQDSVKMGALMSFGAAVISFGVAKALGIKANKLTTPQKDVGGAPINAVASGS